MSIYPKLGPCSHGCGKPSVAHCWIFVQSSHHQQKRYAFCGEECLAAAIEASVFIGTPQDDSDGSSP